MYWLYILVLAVILYVLGSIRVLRQYERGVVFLLGKFEGVRGAAMPREPQSIHPQRVDSVLDPIPPPTQRARNKRTRLAQNGLQTKRSRA